MSEYRRWDLRAEQFVNTFRNWRATHDAGLSDHVDRRWPESPWFIHPLAASLIYFVSIATMIFAIVAFL